MHPYLGDDMKQLIGGLCMAVTLLVAPGAALADARSDEAARLALANKFVMLIQGEEMTTAMGQMVESMIPESDEDLSASDAAAIREVVVDMTQAMMPRMFEAMAPVYADIFTLEELRAMVAFYESDVGQNLLVKSVQAMPRLNAAAMSVMPEMLAGMGDAMCSRLKCTPDERREMKAAMAEAAQGMAAQ